MNAEAVFSPLNYKRSIYHAPSKGEQFNLCIKCKKQFFAKEIVKRNNTVYIFPFKALFKWENLLLVLIPTNRAQGL